MANGKLQPTWGLDRRDSGFRSSDLERKRFTRLLLSIVVIGYTDPNNRLHDLVGQ